MRQKTDFSVVEMRSENVAFVFENECSDLGIPSRLGQMAHRRQIAQWVGTRTTHPGGTGFEPQGVALAVVVVLAGPLLQPGPG